MAEQNQPQYIKTFSQIDKNDIALAGGKGANLGEMVRAGLPVPDGFVLTAKAYFYFLKANNLKERISKQLGLVNKNDPVSFERVSQEIQKLIESGETPRDVAKEVFQAYEQLVGLFGKTPVAVRSSATAEDLPEASFAGQQSTFLNVIGEASLLQKVKSCWASLFTPRAIFYREEKKFGHLKVGLCVLVQKMIDAEASGVMFTLDPVTNNKKIFVIEAIWGLGELLVQGSVTPDHFEVEKETFKICQKILTKQTIKMSKKNGKNLLVKVSLKEQEKQKIPDKIIIKLAHLGKKIHQHYFYPQDIEWAVAKGKIYILQTRAVTTLQKEKIKKTVQEDTSGLKLILKGEPASPSIGAGYVRIIPSAKQIGQIKEGEVLVTEMTTPDFVPAMKKVVAIVTDRGGQTSHAAIVSRELGLACVVGTSKGTKILKNGQVVTVNGKTGEIFAGSSPKTPLVLLPKNNLGKDFSLTPLTEAKKFSPALRTATKLYVNLAEPDLAEKIARQDVDGVGLLRAEFMIAQIGIHPQKMIEEGKKEVFIDKLVEGMARLCRAFSPRPVVYRATDFKTSEYANLAGGQAYEPKEANPMLGYRGACRYVSDEKVFALELAAIKKVRHKLDLHNLWLMIPFVRTVEELWKVKRIVASHGLIRSPSFKLWMMVEIPANVILLADFIKVGVDGISIGSNDLTMLILGLDRDNEKVASAFDERNEAVLWALEKTIRTCRQQKITSSICGQAPSQYPDLMEKLIAWGITSISVNPDVIASSRKIIYEAEKKLLEK